MDRLQRIKNPWDSDLVTTVEKPFQGVPRYDGADPGLVAMSHYLCSVTCEATASTANGFVKVKV